MQCFKCSVHTDFQLPGPTPHPVAYKSCGWKSHLFTKAAPSMTGMPLSYFSWESFCTCRTQSGSPSKSPFPKDAALLYPVSHHKCLLQKNVNLITMHHKDLGI